MLYGDCVVFSIFKLYHCWICGVLDATRIQCLPIIVFLRFSSFSQVPSRWSPSFFPVGAPLIMRINQANNNTKNHHDTRSIVQIHLNVSYAMSFSQLSVKEQLFAPTSCCSTPCRVDSTTSWPPQLHSKCSRLLILCFFLLFLFFSTVIISLTSS